MEENIRLDWLEGSLAFLREILDSPEKLAWCRGFGSDVPQEFQEEVGEFLLGYRESGAEKICRDALRGLGGEGLRLSSGEDVKSASDAELESRLAGLMDGDSPFVLYGMSSGLLYDLLDELLSRRKKELREGYVCRLDGSSLDEVAALGESLRPGSGEAVRRTFALQLADPKAALFGCRREDGLIGLAHTRIRTDYVEGARENEKGVAYLEGIYLKEDAAPELSRKLIAAVSDWAREMGCRELAADCEQGDDAGAALREAAGFKETARIICYIKEL
jgi:aminoglycoside 6'-N-acetyltransferase I